MSRSGKPDSYLCVSVFICGQAFASRQADTLAGLFADQARQLAEQLRAALIVTPLLRAGVIIVMKAAGSGRDPELAGGALLVDDDLATVREFEPGNLAGAFENAGRARGVE